MPECNVVKIDLSLPCVMEVVNDVRSGTVTVRTFNVIAQQVSAALQKFDKNSRPDVFALAASTEEGPSTEEVLSNAEALCTGGIPQAEGLSDAVNPIVVNILVQLLQEVLKRWLKS